MTEYVDIENLKVLTPLWGRRGKTKDDYKKPILHDWVNNPMTIEEIRRNYPQNDVGLVLKHVPEGSFILLDLDIGKKNVDFEEEVKKFIDSGALVFKTPNGYHVFISYDCNIFFDVGNRFTLIKDNKEYSFEIYRPGDSRQIVLPFVNSYRVSLGGGVMRKVNGELVLEQDCSLYTLLEYILYEPKNFETEKLLEIINIKGNKTKNYLTGEGNEDLEYHNFISLAKKVGIESLNEYDVDKLCEAILKLEGHEGIRYHNLLHAFKWYYIRLILENGVDKINELSFSEDDLEKIYSSMEKVFSDKYKSLINSRFRTFTNIPNMCQGLIKWFQVNNIKPDRYYKYYKGGFNLYSKISTKKKTDIEIIDELYNIGLRPIRFNNKVYFSYKGFSFTEEFLVKNQLLFLESSVSEQRFSQILNGLKSKVPIQGKVIDKNLRKIDDKYVFLVRDDSQHDIYFLLEIYDNKVDLNTIRLQKEVSDELGWIDSPINSEYYVNFEDIINNKITPINRDKLETLVKNPVEFFNKGVEILNTFIFSENKQYNKMLSESLLCFLGSDEGFNLFLTGGSGSGKTTLAKILSKIENGDTKMLTLSNERQVYTLEQLSKDNTLVVIDENNYNLKSEYQNIIKSLNTSKNHSVNQKYSKDVVYIEHMVKFIFTSLSEPKLEEDMLRRSILLNVNGYKNKSIIREYDNDIDSLLEDWVLIKLSILILTSGKINKKRFPTDFPSGPQKCLYSYCQYMKKSYDEYWEVIKSHNKKDETSSEIINSFRYCFKHVPNDKLDREFFNKDLSIREILTLLHEWGCISEDPESETNIFSSYYKESKFPVNGSFEEKLDVFLRVFKGGIKVRQKLLASKTMFINDFRISFKDTPTTRVNQVKKYTFYRLSDDDNNDDDNDKEVVRNPEPETPKQIQVGPLVFSEEPLEDGVCSQTSHTPNKVVITKDDLKLTKYERLYGVYVVSGEEWFIQNENNLTQNNLKVDDYFDWCVENAIIPYTIFQNQYTMILLNDKELHERENFDVDKLTELCNDEGFIRRSFIYYTIGMYLSSQRHIYGTFDVVLEFFTPKNQNNNIVNEPDNPKTPETTLSTTSDPETTQNIENKTETNDMKNQYQNKYTKEYYITECRKLFKILYFNVKDKETPFKETIRWLVKKETKEDLTREDWMTLKGFYYDEVKKKLKNISWYISKNESDSINIILSIIDVYKPKTHEEIQNIFKDLWNRSKPDKFSNMKKLIQEKIKDSSKLF